MTGRHADECGSMTAFLAIFMVALVALSGLVIDGGRGLIEKRRAIDEARAAARAGAGALAIAPLRQGGTYTLNPQAAEDAARAYLAATGHDGQVSVADDLVEVRVRISQPTVLLGVLGLRELSLEGIGRARAVHGVTREEP
ncbi:MAG: pilus assembly protein TadG-related protein [Actinomycetota bacterium]|jgi:hypothetical protein